MKLLLTASRPLVLAIALWTGCVPSHAAAERPSLSDYQQTTWTEKDGAPRNTWAIAQTTDGWLWFGGPSGLVRFDGVVFERRVLDSRDPERNDPISSLLALPDGGLLVGHHNGSISLLRSGRVEHFDDQVTRSAGVVAALARDDEGGLWAATGNGLLRFDGRAWRSVGAEWKYPGELARCAIVDGNGQLWIATPTEVLRMRRGMKEFEPVARVRGVLELIQSPDGQVWAISQTDHHLLSSEATNPRRSPLFNSRMSYMSMFDRDGNFWAWLDDSFRAPEPAIAGVATIGSVKTVLEDRQGNLWFGDQGARIHRLTRRTVARVAGLPVLAGTVPYAALAPDDSGAMWIATADSRFAPGTRDGVWKFGGALQRVQQDEMGTPTAIARGPGGSVWIGEAGKIWRNSGRPERPFVKAVEVPPEAAHAVVSGISVDFAGALWVGFKGIGLFKHDGNGWHRNGDESRLPNETPAAQSADSSGRVWLGYSNGALARIDAGGVTTFTAAEELRIGAISVIGVGRHTLVAGARSLYLERGGRLVELKPGIPGAFDGVSGIVELANGDVWLNSALGAVHVRGADLDVAAQARLAVLPITLFDESDGFPGASANTYSLTPTIAQSSNGQIWVAGNAGIGVIDPTRVERPEIGPRAVIISVGGRESEHETLPQLTLAEGSRIVRATYTALGSTHPHRLRFRYRLEGLEEDWTYAATRREANYANLGPGTYRFQVEATDGSNAWNDAPNSVVFVIPPTFVQSRLFFAICVIAILAALALVYRLRVAQITAREQSRVEERTREREHIARELHDTLLQSVQVLVLKFGAVSRTLPLPDLERKALDEAVDAAQEAIVESRDRIQGLRSNVDRDSDLAGSLATIGQAAEAGAAEFSVVAQGSARPLRPHALDVCYRVAREAILNAFRHSGGKSIEVQIIYGDTHLRIRVRDDGVGLPPQSAINGQSRHWGLAGMAERVEAIGGSLEIWTRANAGTEIELVLSAQRAYSDEKGPVRWPHFVRRWVSGGLAPRGGAEN
jgi:signal transduction histidine kinase/ligand-binding sensor domain-containing protein